MGSQRVGHNRATEHEQANSRSSILEESHLTAGSHRETLKAFLQDSFYHHLQNCKQRNSHGRVSGREGSVPTCRFCLAATGFFLRL